MAVPYLETEIDISTFLNRGRLPDLYLKINLFEKYFANILTEKPFLFYAHRVVMIRVITFALKKPARVEWGEKIDFTGGVRISRRKRGRPFVDHGMLYSRLFVHLPPFLSYNPIIRLNDIAALDSWKPIKKLGNQGPDFWWLQLLSSPSPPPSPRCSFLRIHDTSRIFSSTNVIHPRGIMKRHNAPHSTREEKKRRRERGEEEK